MKYKDIIIGQLDFEKPEDTFPIVALFGKFDEDENLVTFRVFSEEAKMIVKEDGGEEIIKFAIKQSFENLEEKNE